jgi:hypothetical protein
MKKLFIGVLTAFISFSYIFSQSVDPWKIKSEKIDPAHYYGVTVANGVVGIVSSPEPLK